MYLKRRTTETMVNGGIYRRMKRCAYLMPLLNDERCTSIAQSGRSCRSRRGQPIALSRTKRVEMREIPRDVDDARSLPERVRRKSHQGLAGEKCNLAENGDAEKGVRNGELVRRERGGRLRKGWAKQCDFTQVVANIEDRRS